MNIWKQPVIFFGAFECVFNLVFKKIQKDINNIILNSVLKKIGLFQIISLSDKRFFGSFCLHSFPSLGAILISQNNLKCWRQYMQNFLRTPLVREFYRNADSKRCHLVSSPKNRRKNSIFRKAERPGGIGEWSMKNTLQFWGLKE